MKDSITKDIDEFFSQMFNKMNVYDKLHQVVILGDAIDHHKTVAKILSEQDWKFSFRYYKNYIFSFEYDDPFIYIKLFSVSNSRDIYQFEAKKRDTFKELSDQLPFNIHIKIKVDESDKLFEMIN